MCPAENIRSAIKCSQQFRVTVYVYRGGAISPYTHDFVSKTAADDSSRVISCDFFSSRKLPKTKTSILVRSKQAKASSGRQTIGSLSLNDVFSKTGTPVKSPKARMSRQ